MDSKLYYVLFLLLLLSLLLRRTSCCRTAELHPAMRKKTVPTFISVMTKDDETDQAQLLPPTGPNACRLPAADLGNRVPSAVSGGSQLPTSRGHSANPPEEPRL